MFHYISSVQGFVRSLHEHRDGIDFKHTGLKSWRPLEFATPAWRRFAAAAAAGGVNSVSVSCD